MKACGHLHWVKGVPYICTLPEHPRHEQHNKGSKGVFVPAK
jgi:hypothetical protein